MKFFPSGDWSRMWGAFLVALASAAVNGGAAPETGEERVLVHDDFSDPAETDWGELLFGWWLEGGASNARARVKEGRLLLDATGTGRGATLWLDQELPEDVEVTFDVHVIDAIKQANNMNFFLGFRDSRRRPLAETREERAHGMYRHYHSEDLTGIIVTYLANGDPEDARLRVRQVPPFNPVLGEFTGHHARQGRTYRFLITRRNDRLTCVVDGRVLLDVALRPDESSQGGGYLGFRTWNTLLWWDNLLVRQLARDPSPD